MGDFFGKLRGLREALGRGRKSLAEPAEGQDGQEQPLAVPAAPEEGEGNARALDLGAVRAGIEARLTPAARAEYAAADAREDARRARAGAGKKEARVPAAAERTAAIESQDFTTAKTKCMRAMREAVAKSDPQDLEAALRTFFDEIKITFNDVAGLEGFLIGEKFFIGSGNIVVPFRRVPTKEGESELVLDAKEWQITVGVRMGKGEPRRTEVAISYCVIGGSPVLQYSEVIKLEEE